MEYTESNMKIQYGFGISQETTCSGKVVFKFTKFTAVDEAFKFSDILKAESSPPLKFEIFAKDCLGSKIDSKTSFLETSP